MKPVIVRNIRIGEGIPKICVPIVGRNREEILQEGENLLSVQTDLAEWRVDFYQHSDSKERAVETAGLLRKVLGDIPLLFTFRSRGEGGEKEISWEYYRELNLAAASSGFVDLVDVEAFFHKIPARELIEELHRAGVKVIGSNHDFNKTPNQDEMIKRLKEIRELGTDIPKIAVMPNSPGDVLTLLSATLKVAESGMDCPIITMSMGKDGMVSRISGGTFGSALTFGTVGKASAPGQIPVKELREMLEILKG